jgi:hypothetical protein
VGSCFAAKDETHTRQEREIGFTEKPNYIDERYKAKTNQQSRIEDTDLRRKNRALYPFLDDDDKKLGMTEEEIVRTEIDITETRLSLDGQTKLRNIISENKESFSLYGEVGTCKSAEPVSFELKNEAAFNIRPFPFSVQEKILIEKEVEKN